MSRRGKDRRKLGINVFSVLTAAKRVMQDPEFETASKKKLAEVILTEIMGKSLPQARVDLPEIDWEAIIAFILKILPLLLLFI